MPFVDGSAAGRALSNRQITTYNTVKQRLTSTLSSYSQNFFKRRITLMFAILIVSSFYSGDALAQPEPLPSWNDTAPKKAIIAFVEKVTREGSSDFVPPNERIATFDNDGTLWCEKPMPIQLFFALDRVKALAPQHPEWKDKEPFASLLKGDLKAALAGGDRALLELFMVTHAGMTTTEFEQIVKGWIATAKHPRFKKPYTE